MTGDFLGATFGFPAVLFTALLVLVVAYWVLVLVGLLGGDADGAEAANGFLSAFGFGGVPASVVLTVLVAVGWFVSLAGTALLNGLGVGTLSRFGSGVVVLLVALVVGGLLARLLVRPLRPLFANGQEASRQAFVGRLCVIRTGQVTVDFGQAEVTAADGSSAVIQVRWSGDAVPAGGDALPASGHRPPAGGARLARGSVALVYDYDADGEFFRVTPVDAALHPDSSPRS